MSNTGQPEKSAPPSQREQDAAGAPEEEALLSLNMFNAKQNTNEINPSEGQKEDGKVDCK